jgi:hypothetical protein
MSGTLERAVEWGYLVANPGRRIKVPPMQRRRKTIVLTRERLATLLQVLQEPVKTLAITVAMTGLRIGEVLRTPLEERGFRQMRYPGSRGGLRREHLFTQIEEQHP